VTGNTAYDGYAEGVVGVRYSPRVQRHAAELVEVRLDRSGATPGLNPYLMQHIARASMRKKNDTHERTRTAGLVNRMPLLAR
jgi:hypothetical protein